MEGRDSEPASPGQSGAPAQPETIGDPSSIGKLSREGKLAFLAKLERLGVRVQDLSEWLSQDQIRDLALLELERLLEICRGSLADPAAARAIFPTVCCDDMNLDALAQSLQQAGRERLRQPFARFLAGAVALELMDSIAPLLLFRLDSLVKKVFGSWSACVAEGGRTERGIDSAIQRRLASQAVQLRAYSSICRIRLSPLPRVVCDLLPEPAYSETLLLGSSYPEHLAPNEAMHRLLLLAELLGFSAFARVHGGGFELTVGGRRGEDAPGNAQELLRALRRDLDPLSWRYLTLHARQERSDLGACRVHVAELPAREKGARRLSSLLDQTALRSSHCIRVYADALSPALLRFTASSLELRPERRIAIICGEAEESLRSALVAALEGARNGSSLCSAPAGANGCLTLARFGRALAPGVETVALLHPVSLRTLASVARELAIARGSARLSHAERLCLSRLKSLAAQRADELGGALSSRLSDLNTLEELEASGVRSEEEAWPRLAGLYERSFGALPLESPIAKLAFAGGQGRCPDELGLIEAYLMALERAERGALPPANARERVGTAGLFQALLRTS